MKTYRYISLFLALILISVPLMTKQYTAQGADDVWPAPPEVKSGNAILIDADTGEILYEKNAFEKAFPASTTKLLTALLVCENANLGDKVTFSYEAAHSYNPGDSNMGIWAGEEMTVEEALRGILMESANEACYGMAEYISGTTDAFVELMNKRAKELGAKDTNFTNTNGLHDNYHYTTCYDMAMIGRACFDNSTIMSICSETTTYSMPATNKYKSTRYMRNKHALLKAREYYYEYALGGKTGYTEEAGHTLVSFAKKDGVRLICVVMRSTADDRYTDTRDLFEYGFNSFQKYSLSSNSLAKLLLSSDSTYEPATPFFSDTGKSIVLKNSIASLIPPQADKSEIYAKTAKENNSVFVTFYYHDHALGSSELLIIDGATPVSDNLPVLKSDVTKSAKKPEVKIIHLKYVYIMLGIIAVVIAIIDYRLIMDKTAFGANVKRKRSSRRRRA